jgi:hypothetical protein
LPCTFSQTYTAKSFLPCSTVSDTRQMLTNTVKNIFPVVPLGHQRACTRAGKLWPTRTSVKAGAAPQRRY